MDDQGLVLYKSICSVFGPDDTKDNHMTPPDNLT